MPNQSGRNPQRKDDIRMFFPIEIKYFCSLIHLSFYLSFPVFLLPRLLSLFAGLPAAACLMPSLAGWLAGWLAGFPPSLASV